MRNNSIYAIIGMVVLLGYYLVTCNGGGSSPNYSSYSTFGQPSIAVEDLYGTYTATDNSGNKITIELEPESHNEYRKCCTYRASNLYQTYTDAWGRVQREPDPRIFYYWSWDLNEGYIKLCDTDTFTTEFVIDFFNKKMYNYWGEYIDDRNGFSYTFSQHY